MDFSDHTLVYKKKKSRWQYSRGTRQTAVWNWSKSCSLEPLLSDVLLASQHLEKIQSGQ
jgi:hypothetical protein